MRSLDYAYRTDSDRRRTFRPEGSSGRPDELLEIRMDGASPRARLVRVPTRMARTFGHRRMWPATHTRGRHGSAKRTQCDGRSHRKRRAKYWPAYRGENVPARVRRTKI